jgi:hypothetical protein
MDGFSVCVCIGVLQIDTSRCTDILCLFLEDRVVCKKHPFCREADRWRCDALIVCPLAASVFMTINGPPA